MGQETDNAFMAKLDLISSNKLTFKFLQNFPVKMINLSSYPPILLLLLPT